MSIKVRLYSFMMIGTACVYATGCGMLRDYGGGDDGQTRVRISRGAGLLDRAPDASAAVTLTNGVYVYFTGVNTTFYDASFYVSDETATTDFVLPNGTYKVHVVGYDGASFAGNQKCGLGEGGATVSLTGGDKIVNVTADTATCGGGAFSTATYTSAGNQFLPVKVSTCSAAEFATVTTAGSVCLSGALSGVQLHLMVYARDSNGFQWGGLAQPTQSVSSCQSFASGAVATGLMLPAGTSAPGNPRIVVRVDGFTASKPCGSAARSYEYQFESGLSNASAVTFADFSGVSPSVTAAVKVFSDGLVTAVFLKDPN